MWSGSSFLQDFEEEKRNSNDKHINSCDKGDENMFQVAVYGIENFSTIIRECIEKQYNSVVSSMGGEILRVVAFGDFSTSPNSVKDDLPILNIPQMSALYKLGIINGIIVPRELILGHNDLLQSLLCNGIGIQDIYITERIVGKEIKGTQWLIFLRPYLSTKYLSYLEFHIADQCNLNCKACEHYSGLVDKPIYPVFSQFVQDFNKLHEFIDDIGVIRILGGEPLLNKEIDKYIRLARDLYPDAIIYVVTNGILLRQMPEHFYQTLRETDTRIHISFYLPLEKKMPEILEYLKERKIVFDLSPLMHSFEMKQTLHKTESPDYFYRCFQSRCHNLYDGKLAACFLPFTTKYFNRYFDQNLPEDGAIDLYTPGLTTEMIKAKLLQPFERCCYCREAIMVDWEQIKQPSVLSDWLVEEN